MNILPFLFCLIASWKFSHSSNMLMTSCNYLLMILSRFPNFSRNKLGYREHKGDRYTRQRLWKSWHSQIGQWRGVYFCCYVVGKVKGKHEEILQFCRAHISSKPTGDRLRAVTRTTAQRVMERMAEGALAFQRNALLMWTATQQGLQGLSALTSFSLFSLLLT